LGDILQEIPSTASIRSFKVYTYPTQWQADRGGDLRKSHCPDHSRQMDRAMSHEIFQEPPLPSNHLPSRSVVGIEKFLVRRLPCWKRIIDMVGSTIGLLLFSPVMLVVAVSIKLTSHGPILFKQRRVGFLGRTFTLLKFRSMNHDNNPEIHKQYTEHFIKNGMPMGKGEGQKSIYKIENDPRVTHVGRFLRKTSLDELPQFVNVLKGEMSLVGPRPPIPYEYMHYDIWHKRRAWEVKPGITGLWQIKGRSKATFDQMARLDLKYLKERSLWLDLKILIQTPWVVFTGKGAY
jgi:exopolysaccharide biosynthesis polyprenyl glycosylphosphotransferase